MDGGPKGIFVLLVMHPPPPPCSNLLFATAIYCRTMAKGSNSLKMKFLVNEQNVSVINAISGCLDLDIFQQDECFCSKLGIQV